MAIIGSWNGFDFEVSPSVVRGFTGLTIKGSSETEDKVSDKQKYVQRVNSAVTEIALTVYLNAYLGCNVRDEALRFVETAMAGESNYFYVAGSKLVNCKLMLVAAEVKETELAPGGAWLSCAVGLTFKQADKYAGLTSGSGDPGTSSKSTLKGNSIFKKAAETIQPAAALIKSSSLYTGAQTLAANAISKALGIPVTPANSEADAYIKQQSFEVQVAQAAGKMATQKKQEANAKAAAPGLKGAQSKVTVDLME